MKCVGENRYPAGLSKASHLKTDKQTKTKMTSKDTF